VQSCCVKFWLAVCPLYVWWVVLLLSMSEAKRTTSRWLLTVWHGWLVVLLCQWLAGGCEDVTL
jgi:hypothetical protein